MQLAKRKQIFYRNGRKTRKATFFSKQLLFFLVIVTLFKSSDDQWCIYQENDTCCSRHNAILASAAVATAAASPSSIDDDIDDDKVLTNPKPAPRSLFRRGKNEPPKKAFVPKSQQAQPSFSEILKKAGRSGIGGGIPGFIAGVVQVLSLMWLRTVVNYQCRYGASFPQALRILYNEGGIPRFYRGMSFALIQAPLARFVATAANDGVETLLENLKLTEKWGPGRSTVIASIVVGMWRIVLMPIDTCKTVLQVDSVLGFRDLMRKVKAGKINVLYQGAIANAAGAIAGHYPWFYTYKVLSRSRFVEGLIPSKLLRNASIGFAASVVSDTVSNAIRVVKTTKQAIAAKHTVSYSEVISMILAADGWKGLFGRGLRTRILGNALQSVLFTIIWRGLAEHWGKKGSSNDRVVETIKPVEEESSSPPSKEIDDAIPMEEERN